MQTWAKRGLQTALVTGGLLMLGTGIASADENVNPDRPASPLDGSVRVPIHLDNNALGTPLGQKYLPALDKEIRVSAGDLTGAVPMADRADPVVDKAEGAAAPVLGTASGADDPTLDKVHTQAKPVLDKATPMTDKVNASAEKAGMPPLPPLPTMSVPQTQGAFEGNRVDGDLVVPVDVSGNAIALLGAAEVANDSNQSYSDSETVVTDGSGGFVSGNVVDLDWALPVQITGNAIAGAGNASSTGSATQDTAVTSDITSDGTGGVLSGNVLAGHWATPAQLTGNAIGGVGHAQSDSTADTTATSGGTVLTSGENSLGSGNIGAAPVATPLEGNGNAIAGLGTADASSMSTATATAGALRDGLYGMPTYLETNGDPAIAAGNIVQPAVSGPALLCGNAGAAAGDATADCTSDSTTTAGGATRSTGEESVLSGTTATTPAALPVEGFGNAAAGVGDADAIADNTVTSAAGGDSYTRGHDSLVSGTIASVAPSGPVDVFGNAAAGAGTASATANQFAVLSSGGVAGTTGDDSFGGGNRVTAPLVAPVEGFGNVAGALGGVDATATEVKTTAADGGGATADDNGVLASNNITTPVASAVQAFGNGAGAVAFTDADASTDTEVVSGGDVEGTGTSGIGSGNVGQTPVSLPAQVFGTGASALAGGEQTATNNTSLTSGGDAYADGQDGVLAGNVVSGPVASAGQAFGESAAVLGVNDSDASSTTSSIAGGTVQTDGTSGLGTGNVASPQALPVVQSFAAAASGVGGLNSATGDNTSAIVSGGDIDTAGDGGFLAGNIADVPAGGVAQPFGDAVAAVGSSSEASGDNISGNAVGGTSTTSGALGALSGIDGTVPVGADAPVYNVPVEVLAQALTDSTNISDLLVGEDASQLNIPMHGGMPATEVPSLPLGRSSARDLPTDEFAPYTGVFSGVLDGFSGGMTGLPAQDQVHDLTGAVSGMNPAARSASPLADNPFAPMTGDLFAGLPTDTLPLGDLPAGGLPTGDLPAGDLPTGDLPVGDLPVGDLPVGDLSVGELPTSGLSTNSLPLGELPVGALPTDGLPVGALPTSDLPVGQLPVGELPATPAADIPALGNADVTEIVPPVPAVGDVPAVPNVPAVSDVQAPALNTMPVEPPAVPGADSSLSATRQALARLFAVNPIG